MPPLCIPPKPFCPAAAAASAAAFAARAYTQPCTPSGVSTLQSSTACRSLLVSTTHAGMRPDPQSQSRQAVMSCKASLQSKTFAEGGGSTWALRGGGGGPGVPEGMGGVCEGTGGVGTMGGGVWEGPWSAPCAAINAMSCTDWSPAEHIPAINI